MHSAQLAIKIKQTSNFKQITVDLFDLPVPLNTSIGQVQSLIQYKAP